MDFKLFLVLFVMVACAMAVPTELLRAKKQVYYDAYPYSPYTAYSPYAYSAYQTYPAAYGYGYYY